MSDKMPPQDLVRMIAAVNPNNVPGRLAVIVRMGAKKLREKFPAMIEAVNRAGQVRGQGGAGQRCGGLGSDLCVRPHARHHPAT